MSKHPSDALDELKDSIVKLEADMLRQEHRLVPLVKNWWHRNDGQYEKGDPRREAVSMAFWWRVIYWLFPIGGSATLAIGGIVTAYLTLQGNSLIEEQNALLIEQTNDLRRQVALERKTSLLEVLYSESPKKNKKFRQAAFEEYLDIIRAETNERDKISLNGVNLSNLTIEGLDLQNVVLSGDFTNTTFIGIKLINSTFIHSTSAETATVQSSNNRVPSIVQTTFVNSDLTNAYLKISPQANVSFYGCNVAAAKFRNADASSTRIYGSILEAAITNESLKELNGKPILEGMQHFDSIEKRSDSASGKIQLIDCNLSNSWHGVFLLRHLSFKFSSGTPGWKLKFDKNHSNGIFVELYDSQTVQKQGYATPHGPESVVRYWEAWRTKYSNLDHIFCHDQNLRQVSLRMLPSTETKERDAILMILFGFWHYEGKWQMTLEEIRQSAEQSGIRFDRIDEILKNAEAGYLIQHNGQYSLTDRILNEYVCELIETMQDDLNQNSEASQHEIEFP